MKHDATISKLLRKLLATFLLTACQSWNYASESRASRIIPKTSDILRKLTWYKTNAITTSLLATNQLAYVENESESEYICERIASDDAAKLIERAYNQNKNEDCSLLLMTSDASRGSNRHSGLTSIVRSIDSSYEHGKDQVTIVTRRVNSMDARDIFQSEVAALTLGIKTAMQCIPSKKRRKVLLLTDSNSALTFFCGDEDNVKSPTSDTRANWPSK